MHAIQASFKKLKNYISNYDSQTSSSFYSVLGQSAWMKSLSRLLALTSKMCSGLRSGNSVFVHCSDGWDRTSQVSLTRSALWLRLFWIRIIGLWMAFWCSSRRSSRNQGISSPNDIGFSVPIRMSKAPFLSSFWMRSRISCCSFPSALSLPGT